MPRESLYPKCAAKRWSDPRANWSSGRRSDRSDLRFFTDGRRGVDTRIGILFHLINLVEVSAVRKVHLLRSIPPSENIINAHQLDPRKKSCVLGKKLVRTWAEIRLHCKLLAIVRPKIFEIGCGKLACAAPVDDLIHHANRRLGENAQRRIDDVEFFGTQDLCNLQHFAFKCEQHVADLFLHEGVAARPPVSSTGTFLNSALTNSSAAAL